MFEALETERLMLKSIGYDDGAFLYRQFSTDEVNAYLFDAEPIASIGEADELIAFYTQDEPRDQHRWILVRKDTNEKIGTCGVHRWDRSRASAEVGYDLQPAYWREGYMSEAMEAVLSFARDRMRAKTLAAHIARGNVASERLAEKLGFRKTDETYEEAFHGKRYPHDVYQLKL